jgi:cytochrome c oxidase subunit II
MRKVVALLAAAVVLLVVSFLPWPGESAPAGSTSKSAGVAPAISSSALTEAEAGRGQELFVAKGCLACHEHRAVKRAVHLPAIGPNLSYYHSKGNAEFLRQWLRDPPAMRPQTRMPNLNLSEQEIEELIAFLLRPGPSDAVTE